MPVDAAADPEGAHPMRGTPPPLGAPEINNNMEYGSTSTTEPGGLGVAAGDWGIAGLEGHDWKGRDTIVLAHERKPPFHRRVVSYWRSVCTCVACSLAVPLLFP